MRKRGGPSEAQQAVNKKAREAAAEAKRAKSSAAASSAAAPVVSGTAVNRLEAEQAHAAAIRHEVKDDGLKQSLADTANKSSYNSGGACRSQMLPPGMYVTFRDLAAPEPECAERAQVRRVLEGQAAHRGSAEGGREGRVV